MTEEEMKSTMEWLAFCAEAGKHMRPASDFEEKALSSVFEELFSEDEERGAK